MIMDMDTEKILRLASGRLESERTHRIDLLRAESGLDAETFDSALSALAEEGVVDLVGGDTSEMSDDQIDGLFNPDGDLPLVNLSWEKDPVRFLFIFKEDVFKAYREAEKGTGNRNKKAFEALLSSDSIPDISAEMKFASFNQYITAIFKLDGYFSAGAKSNNKRIEQLETELGSLKRSKSTLEDVYKDLLHEHDELAAGTLQRRIDSLENTLAKVKTERDFLKKSAMELSDELNGIRHEGNDYRRRINTLEEAHKELLKEIDIRNKEISRLRAQTHQTPTSTPEPEPKQIKLFDDEGEKNMRDVAAQNRIGVLERQMAGMQASFETKIVKLEKQIESIFSRPADIAGPTTSTTKKIKDPDKPENVRVGAWNLNPVKRGSAWFFRAFRTYPGQKSPACVYIGKDTSRENVAKCLNAYNAKKGTDYQID